jgi:small subunit ribosomal protein S20
MFQVVFVTKGFPFLQEVNVMPNIKSAVKRVKTIEKRRALNASQKSALRTAVKAADLAVVATDVEVAKAALILATKKLDKAVTKGLIHKNAASRKKSRLAKKLNALSAQA